MLTLERFMKIVGTTCCRVSVHMAHMADWIREYRATILS